MDREDKGTKLLDESRARRPQRSNTLDLLPEALRIYREGLGRGDRTGWRGVDELFTVAPGQITVVYGYPNSGKSQWVDALALNLARQGWRFVFASFENIPSRLHAEKFAMQFIGKPVRTGQTPRMSEDELAEALTEMSGWFEFVQPSDARPVLSLLDVVETVEESFKERELWESKELKLACVIDPWNELEHVRPKGMLLSEYIGESLSHLRAWSRRHALHVFLVAHPAKQYPDRKTGTRPKLTPDSIADSAHFYNKADNCILIERDDDAPFPVTRVHVQKIRFAHIGRRGECELEFDRVSGRYREKQTQPAFFTVKRVPGEDDE